MIGSPALYSRNGSQRLARLELCADFAKRTGPGASRNQRSSSAMCDYSLHHVKSRPAKVGDKLRTVNFNTGTRGFASPDDRTTAVCVLPGNHRTQTALFFSAGTKARPRAKERGSGEGLKLP